MNTNNPFVIRTKEYESLQRFFSDLKKFKAKIRLRRVAVSASILAMDPLIYFAEANKGKAIGPKMKDKLLDVFRSRISQALEEFGAKENDKEDGFYSLVIYPSWNRPYSFMDSPEFSIEYNGNYRLDREIVHVNSRLGCWAPKLDGSPYENTINDCFIDCLRESNETLQKYLKQLDEFIANEKSRASKMTKAYIKFLASVKETQEVLQDFSVSGTFFGTLHDASLAFHTIH